MDSERRIATIIFSDVVGLTGGPTPVAGERRVATVLFADVSGFTAMAETMDPEDVRETMNRCFTVLEQAVREQGGQVEKYIGDCIVAVFGVPVPLADTAAAGVNAAIVMRTGIQRLARELDPPRPLDIHIGISSGMVVTGDVGGEVRRDLPVMGEVVDQAAQLQDVSPKGAIWVGPRTYQETRDIFEYRALRPPARGSAPPPGSVYEVLSSVPHTRTAAAEPVTEAVVVADPSEAASEGPGEVGGEVMNRCLALFERAVRDHGGHVDKYLRRGIMAIFGAPTALENAPRAAVNAAIEMRNRLRDAARADQVPANLNLHTGVNTGLVFAGDVGGEVKRDFTVMGDAVNLASRLKDASSVGAIWVGPQTYRYTRHDFEYRTLAPLTLKNKRQPIPAYEVTSVLQQVHRQPAGRDRMIFSDLVGRERELEEIRERVERLLEGEGGIVSVIADAGLGKSRLMAEVAALDEMQGVLRLEGRSLSVGRSLSFHPFTDLLKHWAGIADQESEAEAYAKLETAVAGLLGEGAGEVFPLVATLMGMRVTGPHADRVAGMEGDALEKLILKAMRDLFAALAAAQPLVLVFEDLHWADASSIVLLESLLRLVLEAPVLIINGLRPEQQQPAQRILTVARRAFSARNVEIPLEPLDAKQCDRLIRNLLKIEDLPYATRSLIGRKAEGNPFFIEEVIRGLIDEGAIEHVNGVFRVTEKIDSVVIPGTIQEVIMTRIERLPERAQTVLRVAAVIGRSFPYRVLSQITGFEAASLEWDLRHLKRRQLIVERQSRGEIEYVFTHAVAQETIYESISQRTRKALHAQVAEAIESLYAERLSDFYGMLAYHYSRAEQLAQAEEYLFKAGDEAARAAASSEALAFFQEASRLYFLIHGDGGDPQRKALLEKNIALALLNRGQLLECLDHFNTALGYLGEPIPQRPLAVQARFAVDLAVLLFRVYTSRGRPPVGRLHPNDRESLEIRYNRHRAQSTSDPKRLFIDTISSVRQLGGTDPGAIEQASGMYAAVGAAFAFAGLSFSVARRILTIAKALSREGSLRDVFVFRSFEFLVDYFAGNWSVEGAIPSELIDQALRHGLAWDVNTYLGLHCEQAIVQGAFERASADIERLAEMVDEYGFEFARSNQHFMAAYLLLEQRRLEPAREAIERYAAGRQEDALNVLALGMRARIEVLSGAQTVAAGTLAQIEAMLPRLGIVPPYHLSAYTGARLLFDVAAVEANLGAERSQLRRLARQARRSRRRAVRLAARIAREQPETYRLAGRLSWLLGRQSQALRWWRRALETGERLGARPGLARTCLEIGQRLAEPASRYGTLDGTAAAAWVEKGRALLVELGLEWDMAQVDRARRAA